MLERADVLEVLERHGSVLRVGVDLRDGMFVAFAHVGARVKWHGGELMTLEKAKLRGETSEGMICAAEELNQLLSRSWNLVV